MPNTGETFAAVKPHLRALVGEMYPGADFELSRQRDSRESFGIEVAVRNEKPGVGPLLERLATPAVPARMAPQGSLGFNSRISGD